jgi:hypothetical protein
MLIIIIKKHTHTVNLSVLQGDIVLQVDSILPSSS